jgi:hypothetical protein
MPDFLKLAELSEDERNAVWRLFGIRYRIWDDEHLCDEDRTFWDGACADAPDWALFQRLTISAADREAREQAERGVEKEFAVFFADADEVKLRDKGNGIQEFSATFDLTKKPDRET